MNTEKKDNVKPIVIDEPNANKHEMEYVLSDKKMFGKTTYPDPETVGDVKLPIPNPETAPVVSEVGIKVFLYEILVYGKESDKEAIGKINRRLLEQITRKGAANLIRIFFYLSATETEEEMQAHCLKECMSKYYSFVTVDTDIKDYVREYIMVIKRLENTMNDVKKMGIKVKIHVKEPAE